MQKTRLGSFTVYYQNSQEFHVVKNEIWSNHAYYFETSNPQPVIIDAGAHIGLATLYWKKLYPGARIIAIEPNPHTRQLLEKNIWENQIEEVTILKQTLGAQNGQQTFFYPDAARDWQLNSGAQPKAWNGQLDSSMQPHTVDTIRLSQLLDQPIDLLKLDIEGVEQAALTEAAGHLNLVKHILVEFHPTANQSFPKVIELLKTTGFDQIKYYQKNIEVSHPKLSQLAIIDAQRIS